MFLWHLQPWNWITYPRKRVATRKPKEESVYIRRKWLTEATTWRRKVKCHNSIQLAIFLHCYNFPVSLSFELTENFSIWLTLYLYTCTPVQPLFPKTLKEKEVMAKRAREWQSGARKICKQFVAQITWDLREKKLPQLRELCGT